MIYIIVAMAKGCCSSSCLMTNCHLACWFCHTYDRILSFTNLRLNLQNLSAVLLEAILDFPGNNIYYNLIVTLQTSPWHFEENHRTLTVTRNPHDNLS